MSAIASMGTVLVSWMLAEEPGEVVPVPVAGPGKAGGDRAEEWPVAALLYELWDEATPVPEAERAQLRLPVGATHADAARLLWCQWASAADPSARLGDVMLALRAMPDEQLRSAYDAMRHERDGELHDSTAQAPVRAA